MRLRLLVDEEQVLAFLDIFLLVQYLFLQIYRCPYYVHYQQFYIEKNKKSLKARLS